jgi:hypothetical protein
MSKTLSNWIGTKIVAEMLEVTSHHVPRIAEEERIRVRRLPGTFPKYWRPDVEALKQRCVQNGPAPELAGV